MGQRLGARPATDRRAWLPALGLSAVLITSACVGVPSAGAPAGPDFAREVRPILSRHCFKCHGPDDRQRKAGLRLDTREGALAKRGSRQVIVPGKPEASELVRRVRAPAGSPGVMPPPATKDSLSAREVDTLRRWIGSGAAFQPHWAFLPPRAGPLPAVRDAKWVRNPIDRFVMARLEAAGLAPSAEADLHTLVRRTYLDLIGLPPTPEEIQAVLADTAPGAYERLVDRLLASPHYGERWARRWLDLARYSDTNGYEKDRPRSIWPYRDWVIDALNRDLPFDQFTIQQIAGDLLPGAGQAERIATGFHRNTMLNEEGGIDPLEFRFHAMVDRVNTTATVWLGLTMGCVQCHSHKYDPIEHSEYYRFMALLNNAEEPEMEVVSPEIAARRREIEARIAALEGALPARFPPRESVQWRVPSGLTAAADSGARLASRPDGSILVTGDRPDTDRYVIEFASPEGVPPSALRLEALPDASLGGQGPGRTPHGNFVLTEVQMEWAGPDGRFQPVRITGSSADFSQEGFSPAATYDGSPRTGWAIHGPGNWNVRRVVEYRLDIPAGAPLRRFRVTVDQQYGGGHTLGCFRLGLAVPGSASARLEGPTHLEQSFRAWLERESARSAAWSVLAPQKATSNLPLLSPQPDGSILVSGDMSKRDEYRATLAPASHPVRSLRLEAIPDPALPRQGPGRVYYEGPIGDFFLSELAVRVGGDRRKVRGASQTFAAGGAGAERCLDGDPQTGWSINGGQGRPQQAVFQLEAPIPAGQQIEVTLLFERYYAAGLGRFRISGSESAEAVARHSPQIERLLATPGPSRTEADLRELRAAFLQAAPELAGARAEIEKLRAELPAYPTTLVFRERPPENPRPTAVHRRGEFLQPAGAVRPAVPAVLPPLPPGAQPDRLALARWLVSPANPLVGRVTMNRAWEAFFGTGLVRTSEEFGSQGELPTHPELLDWLALEFIRQGWSMKRMHRLIVTSATYRQSSRVNTEAARLDPKNRLLGWMPRLRLEAEQVRDSLLRVSGLLSTKVGGPSVFPPQPAGVTAEGTYGPLSWRLSEGEDRYRRGLYTFAKRTAPYAMAATFDAPSGEACLVRRERTNSALQALTMLNDQVCLEAARSLAGKVAAGEGDNAGRIPDVFLRALGRPARGEEVRRLQEFLAIQAGRLQKGELSAEKVAGPGEGPALRRAAWTLVIRAMMNLDEFVSRE